MKYSNLVLEEISIEELISKNDVERIESFLVDILNANKKFLDPLDFFSDEVAIDHFAPYKWVVFFRRLKKLPKNKYGVKLYLSFDEEIKELSFIINGFDFLHEKKISLNSLNSIEQLFEICENFINEIIKREDNKKGIEEKFVETLKQFVSKVVKFLRSIKMTNINVSKTSFQPITSFDSIKVYSEVRYGLVTGEFRRTVFPHATYDYETKEERYFTNHVSWFSSEDVPKERVFNNSEEFLTTGFEEWKNNFIKAAQIRRGL